MKRSRYTTRSVTKQLISDSDNICVPENIKKRQSTVGDIFRRAAKASSVLNDRPKRPSTAKKKEKSSTIKQDCGKTAINAMVAHKMLIYPYKKKLSACKESSHIIDMRKESSVKGDCPETLLPLSLFREKNEPKKRSITEEIHEPDCSNTHYLEYRYKYVSSSDMQRLLIEQLEILVSTSCQGGSFYTCHLPRVLFLASVDAHEIDLLILENPQQGKKVCDLVLIDSDSVLLKRIRLIEGDIIAFDATHFSLSNEQLVPLSHADEGVRVVYATKNRVYIIEFDGDEIRKFKLSQRKTAISCKNTNQKLEKYYTRDPSMHHEFQTCIQKNGIRFLENGRTLLIVMTDGSVFLFYVNSGDFVPFYFTNLFQREYIDLLQRAKGKKANLEADVEEFAIHKRYVTEVNIQICGGSSAEIKTPKFVESVPSDDNLSSMLSIQADGHLLVLLLSGKREVLLDSYAASRKNVLNITPFLFSHGSRIEKSLYFLRIGGNKMRLSTRSCNSMVEEFSCDFSKRCHKDLAQGNDLITLNLAPWVNMWNRNCAVFRAKDGLVHYLTFSSNDMSIENDSTVIFQCKVSPASRITSKEAHAILDSGLQYISSASRHLDISKAPFLRSIYPEDGSCCQVLRMSSS